MSKTFRQYDSRWGALKYPSGADTMANSGCGPTACADIIAHLSSHKNITPKETRSYMVKHGYAISGNGTAWAGITACLNHYGYNVKRFSINSATQDMSKVWKELKSNGYRKGIILFRGGKAPKSKVVWTTTGHYVAFSEYKYEGGLHKCYTRDPGARKNDGWHSFEKDMKGLVMEVWTVTPKAKTTKTKFLYASTLYASQVEKSPWKYSNTNSKKSWVEAKKNHIMNCARLMSMVMQYAGVISKGTAVYVKDGKLKGDKAAIDALKKSDQVSLIHPNKQTKSCALKEGDIVGFRNHMMMYRGKDKHGHRLWDSAGSSDMKVHNCTKRVKTSYDDDKVYLIIRPKG